MHIYELVTCCDISISKVSNVLRYRGPSSFGIIHYHYRLVQNKVDPCKTRDYWIRLNKRGSVGENHERSKHQDEYGSSTKDKIDDSLGKIDPYTKLLFFVICLTDHELEQFQMIVEGLGKLVQIEGSLGSIPVDNEPCFNKEWDCSEDPEYNTLSLWSFIN